jgi:hypothetical protein
MTRQDVIDAFADRLGESAILFAKIEQRHAHGAKSMAVSVLRSRKIDLHPVSAAKHLVATGRNAAASLSNKSSRSVDPPRRAG